MVRGIFDDIAGRVFGKLTVIQYAGKDRLNNTQWVCRCLCGNTKIIRRMSLVCGDTKSCGCLINQQKIRHGHARGHRTPEYQAFVAARHRCLNPNARDYACWGGRGIEFRFATFEDFLEHIGPRPDPALSLDRINNNGHYEIGNVRWATIAEQTNNKRTNTPVTAFEQTKNVRMWSVELGLPKSTLYSRLKRGWPIELALTLPAQGKQHKVEVPNGPKTQQN